MQLALMTMHSTTLRASYEWHATQSRLSGLMLRARMKALQRYKLPESTHVALAVDGWLRSARIGNAYAQRFPHEWALTQTSTCIAGAVMCPRESEFFSLVAGRLPTVGWSNYFWGPSNRPAHLTLRTCGYELHAPDEFEQCEPTILALEYLAAPDSLCADRLWHYLREMLPCVLPKWHETYAWLDCCAFRQQAQRTGMRQFVHLADAMDVINGLTGNRYLDSDHEDVQQVGWMDSSLWITAQAVRMLEREWSEARRLIGRVRQTAAWLRREPARWAEVIGMVARAITQESREQRGGP